MRQNRFGLILASIIAGAGAIGGYLVSRGNNAGQPGATGTGRPGAGGYRSEVVRLARAEVGKRDLDRYFASACPPCVGSNPEWCGIFALYILRQARLTDWQWAVGSGFLSKLPRTNEPQPGDLAYFASNQHHAIVVGVRGDTVDLVNGNGVGGVVSESSPPKAKAQAYFSIQPLIDAAGGNR